jgi:glutamyl-tRNA reductase
VPRDLDARIARLDGCFLYDIDDLEAVVAETLAGRRAEADRAEQLVAEEAERFRAWHASLDVVPAIASLRARAEEIRAGELAKLNGRVSEDERRTLESVTAQILNKLLHLPTVRMKEAAAGADGAAYADAVTHLFGLDDDAKC